MANRRFRMLGATACFALMTLLFVPPAGASNGYTQISGLGEFPDGACTEDPQGPPDYIIALSGDLDGCVYGYVESFRFHEGGGTYQESALEIFIGSWGELEGSFQMQEFFTAKFTEDFTQEFGRCQHPIIKGSGTGDFVGIEGRLDFKDDIEAGNAPYRGHLRLG